MKFGKIAALFLVMIALSASAAPAENEWTWDPKEDAGYGWNTVELGDASVPIALLSALAGLTGGGALIAHKSRKNKQ